VTGSPPGVAEEWIVDATPVIILAKIGLLDLLTHLARAGLLPSPVVREFAAAPWQIPARNAVETGWGKVVAVRYIRVAVRSAGLLDLGEQSVLTLALQRPGARVVLDDGQARKTAQRLGLPMVGTVGVIVVAKQRELISTVAPLFDAIRAAGIYAGDDLLSQVAASVGEVWPERLRAPTARPPTKRKGALGARTPRRYAVGRKVMAQDTGAAS
jgi:predicted nucleic acid-binding protein